jgi:hypothetical protein
VLKRIQSFLEFGYLLLDLPQFRLVLDLHEIGGSKLLSYVLFELASQGSEVRVSLHGRFPVFKLVRLNAGDDKLAGDAVLVLGGYVTERGPLAVSLTALRHVSPIHPT